MSRYEGAWRGGGLILIRVGGGVGIIRSRVGRGPLPSQCSASGGQGAWLPLPPKNGGGRVLTALNTGLTYIGIYISETKRIRIMRKLKISAMPNRSGRGLIIGVVGEGGE